MTDELMGGSWVDLGLAAALGLLAGGVCFGGLWWTVQRLADAERPALLALGGTVLRMGVVLLALWLAARAGWQPALACLVGIIAARELVRRFVEAPPRAEGNDAPQP